MAGVRTDCKVTLWIDGMETASETGEIQLTDYGISGIPVFQISGMAARALEEKRKASVTLNFSQNIQRRTFKNFSQKGKKNIRNFQDRTPAGAFAG